MNDEQMDRYSRHLTLPVVGETGQEVLLNSRVLVVGMGGLGSPVAMYLAAAGVGTLILADFDQVEVSNLQRQIAHTSDRVGMLKTHSAQVSCHAINPDVTIETIDFALESEELDQIVADVDAVVEGSDNFPTRFAVNAACVRHAKPLISGAAIRMDGQISVFNTGKPDQPCYQCLYRGGSEAAETCALTGVLGPVVGVIGSLQALETIKVLLGVGETLESRLLLFDGQSLQWQEVKLTKNPDCPVCSGATTS